MEVCSYSHHKADKIKPTDKYLSRQQLKGIIFQLVSVHVWRGEKKKYKTQKAYK